MLGSPRFSQTIDERPNVNADTLRPTTPFFIIILLLSSKGHEDPFTIMDTMLVFLLSSQL
eukprot:m.6349 g.6349  ORF g.6349 m.6349 type:complete len:60 (-) comp5975_c0_seq1:416-595(-)